MECFDQGAQEGRGSARLETDWLTPDPCVSTSQRQRMSFQPQVLLFLLSHTPSLRAWNSLVPSLLPSTILFQKGLISNEYELMN